MEALAAGGPRGPEACPGRPEASRQLYEAIGRAREGRGSTWLLTGAPGIGKSFFLDWVAKEAAGAGFGVLRCGFPDRAAPPLAPLTKALDGLVDGGGDRPHGPRAPTPPALTILSHIRALIRATAERPVALLLDDAHRADPESVIAFQLFSRAFGGLRGIMVGTLADRTVEDGPEGGPLWERTLELLSDEGTIRRLPLEGLDGPACRGVIEDAAGGELSGPEGDELVEGLVARTGGNPLFLREIVTLLKDQHQLLVEGGKLRLSPVPFVEGGSPIGGGWGRFPLPPTLRRLVLSRLDHVLPADLLLLQTAALIGGPFDLLPLVGVLSRTLRDVRATCRDLERLGLVRPCGGTETTAAGAGEAGEEAWEFSHDLVWEVVLRDASNSDLRTTSRKLAGWWSANRPEEVETIARLFHDAQEPLEGLAHVREAIDRALRSEATAAAETYFRWYFDLLALVGDRHGELPREALGLVDGLLVRRLRRETLAVLEELERAYPSEEMHWEVGWRQVHVLVSFDLTQAERKLDELSRELETVTNDRRGVRPAQLAFVRCEVLGARLRWPESIAAGIESLALWGDLSSAWEKGRTLYEVGWAQLMLGRLPAAREFLEELRALTLRTEAPALMATSLVFEGTLSLMEGNLRAASRAYEEASTRLLELGAMEGYGIAKNNLAEVLVHQGRLEEARAALAEAELVGGRFGYPRVVQGCALKWAWLDAFEGRWADALLALEDAQKGARDGDFDEELLESQLLHAWAVGCAGAPEVGLRELETVRKASEKLQPHVRPCLFRVEGELLELAGRPGAREALERSLESARRFSGPEGQAGALRSIARWERRHGGIQAAEKAEAEASRILGGTGGEGGGRPPLPHG